MRQLAHHHRTGRGPAAFAGLAAWALLAALLGGAGGCNIVGPAFYMVHGPDKIPAAYTLPEKKSAVIFIDDRASRVPSRSTRAMIGESAERAILDNDSARDMIASRSALQAALGERFGQPLTIVEIGKAVKADLVIFATVDAFALSEDGESFAPQASFRVKVVDVASEKRLFPAPDSGQEWAPLNVKLPPQTTPPPTSSAEVHGAYQDLARWSGRALGRMFFEYEPDKGPQRLDEAR